jgi:hypothetical protein
VKNRKRFPEARELSAEKRYSQGNPIREAENLHAAPLLTFWLDRNIN